MASEKDRILSPDHIASGQWNPTVSHEFEFIILDMGEDAGLINPGVDPDVATSADRITGAQEIFRETCYSVSVPQLNLGRKSLQWGNLSIKWPGVGDWADLTMEFAEFIEASAREALSSWRQLELNTFSKAGGHASEYKKTCVLIEYGADHLPFKCWTLEGCWIYSLTEPNYSRDSDEVRRISVTIVYDNATEEYY